VHLSKDEYNGTFPNELKNKSTDLLDKGALDLTSVEKTRIITYL